jgi:hypothetical protein
MPLGFQDQMPVKNINCLDFPDSLQML